jgi:hypothetical protein
LPFSFSFSFSFADISSAPMWVTILRTPQPVSFASLLHPASTAPILLP